MRKIFRLLTIHLIAFFLAFGYTKTFAGPPAFERYDDRGFVLELSTDKTVKLGNSWEKIKFAQIEAIAQMIESYPNDELYFLARDSEFLYDFAVALLKDDPKNTKRLHLVNLSRINVKDPLVKNYLSQEGINSNLFRGDKRAILVDTGFKGSISLELSKLYNSKEAGKIQNSSSLFGQSRTSILSHFSLPA